MDTTIYYRTILPDYALDGREVRNGYTTLILGHEDPRRLDDSALTQEWQEFVAATKPDNEGMWLADEFANEKGEGAYEWVLVTFFSWLMKQGYVVPMAWDPTWIVPMMAVNAETEGE